MSPVAPASDPLAPRRFFANHLRRLMEERGWSQSELARRAFKGDDKHGARRDLISKYLRLRSYPDEENMRLLAGAFDITVEQMMPSREQIALRAAEASMVIVEAPNDMAYLNVFNRFMPYDLASEIVAKIRAYDKDHAARAEAEAAGVTTKAKRR